jgi:hypothetical protein
MPAVAHTCRTVVGAVHDLVRPCAAHHVGVRCDDGGASLVAAG